jgi:hypothetical protein
VSPSGFTIILHLDLLATTHSQQQLHYKSVFAFTQDQTASLTFDCNRAGHTPEVAEDILG